MRTGYYDEHRAYEATFSLADAGIPFTAMFASNDIMALSIMRAL